MHQPELRMWNSRYYVHSCPREGYADVSDYIIDEEKFYKCPACDFRFPSMLVDPPLPKTRIGTYGHLIISCVLRSIVHLEL